MHSLDQLRAGELIGITRLNLRGGLSAFPREIFDLADTLEILDLSGNALSSLPDDFSRLHKLRIIFCSDNQFTELPMVLGQCIGLSMIGFKANRIIKVSPQSLPAQLRWLVLTNNLIEELPAEIGNCTRLQKLMLSGNQLRSLPLELAACSQLELLRVAANKLNEFPAHLLSLPRLSWLAYAGNPFCEKREDFAASEAFILDAHWDQLQICNQLGEGASGVIYKAAYRDADDVRSVAVKLFKGDVTSDGLPHCEMLACIAAGMHPNLISIERRLTGHPEGMNGLLMPLIDPEFSNLSGPPSLHSCTRDIYGAELFFDLATVLKLVHGIASAAAHLHRRGIMHGDLYAHNILFHSDGRALLGDFGAASLFDPESSNAQILQRIEVRAFGYLLEEMIARCQTLIVSQAVLEQLLDLQTACLNEKIEFRPLFDDVESTLSRIAGWRHDEAGIHTGKLSMMNQLV
jgi:predicted Ser/Thr protein kinase